MSALQPIFALLKSISGCWSWNLKTLKISHIPHQSTNSYPIPQIPPTNFSPSRRYLLLQHINLLTLITRRLPHLLLPLVIHHLLHHPPRLPVQIPQFAIIRRDLARVDLERRVCGYRGPPFHLVGFVEVDGDFFLVRRQRFERPGGFIGVDRVREGTLWVARKLS